MSVRRAVLLSNKHPYPPDDGKKIVLRGLVEHLVDRLGAGAVTYVVIGEPTLVPLPCPTVFVAPPGPATRVVNAALELGLHRERSLQEAVTGSRRVERRVAELVGSLAPDLIVYDTLRVAQFGGRRRLPGPRHVVYLDDLMALRFRNLSRLADAWPDAAWDPLGTFLPFVPKLVAPILRRRTVQRTLFRIEEERIGRSERAALGDHDLALLINPGEAALLRQETGCAHVAPIKPMLMTPAPPRRRRWRGAPTFLVLGSLRNAAHAASTGIFLERELHALIRRIPDVRLRIVGEGANPRLLAVAVRHPEHVTFEGFVDDLDDVLATACALLAPLAFGGGLKLKVLTALAAGLPVISTRFGVDGMPLVPNVECLVEDDLERWPDALTSLLDPALNHAMGTAGRAAFAAHFSREVVFREYDTLLGT